MDPADQAIIDSFSDLERQFYEWISDPNSTYAECTGFCDGSRKGEELIDAVIEKWGIEVLNQFMDFADKWIYRELYRADKLIPQSEVINRIANTNCMDNSHIMLLRGTAEMGNPEPIILGEGNIHGNKTGYILHLNPSFLLSDDIETEGQDDWLDQGVLAINIHIPFTAQGASTPSNNPGLSLPQKRRRESHGSGEDSTMSTRSFESDTFDTNSPPFCFLQLGHLKYYSGNDWEHFKLPDFHSGSFRSALKWKRTEWGVVARLDERNYPTGAVYVIYNFREMPDPDDRDYFDLTLVQQHSPRDIETTDSKGNELCHIRRLPVCNERFFMAKIADSIHEFGWRNTFNFKVVLESRRKLVPTKLAGPPINRVIPVESEHPSSTEHKRSRA